MNVSDIDFGPVYRYINNSGFVIETADSVLPVFKADTASLEWYNFNRIPVDLNELDYAAAESVLTDPFNPPSLFVQPKLRMLSFGASITESWSAPENNPAVSGIWFEPENNPSILAPLEYFYFGDSIGQLTQLCSTGCDTHYREIVDHRPRVLLAGHEYLISRSDRERSELSAKDHNTHFESLTLSREHKSNLLSTAVTRLKHFGGRIWLKYLGCSNGASTAWSQFTRPSQPRVSFAVCVHPTS